ncbi:MAG: stage III sporulation protein AE [Clostridia bacterium]|nr:stage III sporulation protein AE [Clostridia bacterium]
MKRILLFGVLLLVLFLLPSSVALAEGESSSFSETEKELEELVDKNLDSLDLSALEQFTASLGLEGGLKPWLESVIQGSVPLSPRTLLSGAWQALWSGLTGALPLLLMVVAVAVLYNLLFGLTDGFLSRQTHDVVYFVCYGAVLLVVVGLVVSVVDSVRTLTTQLTTLMNGLTPPLLTLMAAVGGHVTSSVFQPQLALISTLVANLVTHIVIPLFLASVVFSVVGNLTQNVRLDRLQSATRYIISSLLALIFGLYVTYLSIAGVAGGMADTLSLRAARYVIGSYVPIVGGYISQGFDLVTASVLLIKNALGIGGVLAVLAVVLSPLLKLMALTLGLKLVAGIIEPVGDKRMASFVGGVGECMRSMVGAVAGVGFVFMTAMLLAILSCSAVL